MMNSRPILSERAKNTIILISSIMGVLFAPIILVAIFPISTLLNNKLKRIYTKYGRDNAIKLISLAGLAGFVRIFKIKA